MKVEIWRWWILRFVFGSAVLFSSCAQHQSHNDLQNDPISVHSKQVNNQENKVMDDGEVDIAMWRKKYIETYTRPTNIDTSYFINGKKYQILFHHYCTMDSGLIVPKHYCWDDTTNAFITHNFKSELVLLTSTDTIFQKVIEKSTFDTLLDTELKQYATFVWEPYLSINKDTIEIDYSITIPVTDIGIGVKIKFDNKGNYSISQ